MEQKRRSSASSRASRTRRDATREEKRVQRTDCSGSAWRRLQLLDRDAAAAAASAARRGEMEQKRRSSASSRATRRDATRRGRRRGTVFPTAAERRGEEKRRQRSCCEFTASEASVLGAPARFIRFSVQDSVTNGNVQSRKKPKCVCRLLPRAASERRFIRPLFNEVTSIRLVELCSLGRAGAGWWSWKGKKSSEANRGRPVFSRLKLGRRPHSDSHSSPPQARRYAAGIEARRSSLYSTCSYPPFSSESGAAGPTLLARELPPAPRRLASSSRHIHPHPPPAGPNPAPPPGTRATKRA
jgi:hypothetical protein